MKITQNTLLIRKTSITNLARHAKKHALLLISITLIGLSIGSFIVYLQNNLGLSYNDARSHLDIGRRVVEGLKPGLAQIGSVWLPLPHLLMVPTIWNDFMWHTGLSGALISMVSFVGTGILVYLFLKELGASMVARIMGVFIFAANINVLYLQSTAMTELLLLFTMTAGVYELMKWQQKEDLLRLVKASFWIMLATLVRYDGWFLFLYAGLLVLVLSWRKKNFSTAEGTAFFYTTLAGIGIALWFLWNLLIFKDPLYFALGPFSAHAQQEQLASAGVLATQHNLLLSMKLYLYALAYNANAFILFLGTIGAVLLWCSKKVAGNLRLVSTALVAPLVFNIIALYLGFSVLFVQGISGDTWFNVRYGIMMAPSIAIFTGYLIHRVKPLQGLVIGLILFVTAFTFLNNDAVTIDDARVGSSQKNVSEVSGWINQHTKDTPGFILISAASHDAIIFSSGLPMSRFIHEGTGLYWETATVHPENWARWIVMRTNDTNDLTFKAVSKVPGLKNYTLVKHFPFADIYEIKPEFVSTLHTTPDLGKQK